MKYRIALVISHPIQHFCPQYASFAKEQDISLKVFFASKLGLEKYVDVQFGEVISWGNLRIEEFDHEFLNNEVIQPDSNIDAPALDNALEKFSPDLVISYGYYQKLQRRAAKWANRKHVPLAYISDSERRQKRSKLKELIKYPFLGIYFRRMSYFLTVGNANEEFYSFYGVKREKFIRMHFPIDVELYERSYAEYESMRKDIRARYFIADSDFLISVVGKLVPWKNQDHIIEAMERLEKQGVYTVLFVIGSGEKLNEWENKAKKLSKSRVIFTGFTDIGILPSYYAATDLYVHPASVEPHSIAISEAIYMGCPVLLSDTCGSYGQDDDVQVTKNGHVYSFGNIEKLAAGIKWFVEHPLERKRMSEFSHELGVIHQQTAHSGVIKSLVSKLS
jgi:glycosyltransferase involved in cell wall biosynthesis